MNKTVARFAFLLLTGVIWWVPEGGRSHALQQQLQRGSSHLPPVARRWEHAWVRRSLGNAFALADERHTSARDESSLKHKDEHSDIRISGGAHRALDRNAWSHSPALLLRSCFLLFLFLPIVLTAGIAYLSKTFQTIVWLPLLRYSIAHGGAAFVKWGQWASTRTDMFPIELCAQLSSLQERAPTHSFAHTRTQIEREFSQSLESLFEEFDPVPIASGSIAQIHRARWQGHSVAVKVRHPNVEQEIHLDFEIMIAVARWIERIPGLDWLSLSESMMQFSHTIGAQTNLTTEGLQLVRFRRNFQGWKDVTIPVVHLMRDSVLVEEYLEGESVNTLLRTSDEDVEKDENHLDLVHFIVTRGEDIYLKMLLHDNFMHADLHPGNILFQQQTALVSASPKASPWLIFNKNNNKKRLPFELQMVDAGMVAELTTTQQLNFIALVEAIGDGDGIAAADSIITFSPHNHLSAAQRELFRADLQALFSKVARGYGTGVDLGEVLRGILSIVRDHKVTIEANYATLVLNAMCLEGMAQSILPSYNIIDGAKVWLKLHKLTKKLPLPVGKVVRKLSWPVLQKLKTWSDRRFLSTLKKKNKI